MRSVRLVRRAFDENPPLAGLDGFASLEVNSLYKACCAWECGCSDISEQLERGISVESALRP